MSIEDFIITVFCLVDAELKKITDKHGFRTRGFKPKPSDSEVITMDVVGEFLGKDTDTGIWRYFSERPVAFNKIELKGKCWRILLE